MKVILLKDVKKIGRKFDEKEVADGYARNLLIPKGLAVPAGTASAKQILAQKNQVGTKRAKEDQVLRDNIAQLAGTTLTYTARANEQGHLFEKLTSEKLSAYIKKERGLTIDASRFDMEPIKESGTHEISVKVDEKNTHFTLEVIGE